MIHSTGCSSRELSPSTLPASPDERSGRRIQRPHADDRRNQLRMDRLSKSSRDRIGQRHEEEILFASIENQLPPPPPNESRRRKAHARASGARREADRPSNRPKGPKTRSS